MFREFWRSENGATSIEYALIACIVSIVIVTSVSIIGQRLSTRYFTPVAQNLN